MDFQPPRFYDFKREGTTHGEVVNPHLLPRNEAATTGFYMSRKLERCSKVLNDPVVTTSSRLAPRASKGRSSQPRTELGPATP
uniref:Uncharacterized protein n=1 Tax=Peronospora matthiolae TaxID=2874970 RepID=A0AAV1TP61_9STRA